MISLIINTVCDAPPDLVRIDARCPPHGQRAYALKNWLLPYYDSRPDIDEILVVGAITPLTGLRKTHFLNVEPRYRHVGDILVQRQHGLEQATGDLLLFQNDDHWLDCGPKRLASEAFLVLPYDIFVPRRHTRLRGQSEPLNDGRAFGYVPFHCAFYTRSILTRCPWNAVDPEPSVMVDVRHSNLLAKAGAIAAWLDEVIAYDIELDGKPWL